MKRPSRKEELNSLKDGLEIKDTGYCSYTINRSIVDTCNLLTVGYYTYDDGFNDYDCTNLRHCVPVRCTDGEVMATLESIKRYL